MSSSITDIPYFADQFKDLQSAAVAFHEAVIYRLDMKAGKYALYNHDTMPSIRGNYCKS